MPGDAEKEGAMQKSAGLVKASRFAAAVWLALVIAVPHTLIGGQVAMAGQAITTGPVMEADDSGPLPAWWVEIAYGRPLLAPPRMVAEPAGTEPTGAEGLTAADDSGPLPAWWSQTAYSGPSHAEASGVASGPAGAAGTATDLPATRRPYEFISTENH